VRLQDSCPVAFTSKKFSPAERNYGTGEQELLGEVNALRALLFTELDDLHAGDWSPPADVLENPTG
jgi:hypothetical protein